jgi:hypothetical protein
VGHYYNPPSPHIGGRQPLEPPRIIPASGPAPTNPPFMGGSKIRSEILISWLPPAPGPYLDMDQPYAPPTMQPVAISSTNGIQPGARVGQDVLDSWMLPAPGPFLDMDQPYAPPLLVPPSADRPIIGAFVSLAVLDAWIPPAPQPIVEVLTVPPVSADRPIVGAVIPEAILISWQLLAPAWQPASYAIQQPIAAASYVPPAPRMMSWQGLDPALQVARDLIPPSGPVPTNPPFMGGASVPEAVLISWLPPAPQPPVTQAGVKQGVAPSAPPIGGGVPAAILQAWWTAGWTVAAEAYQPQGAPQPAKTAIDGILQSWLPPAPQPPVIADNTIPASADRPISASVPNAVMASWQTAVPSWQPQSYPIQQPAVPSYVPPAARVMPSWPAPDPAFQSSSTIDPPRSGPVPSNPPVIGGSAALQAIYAAWNVPLPAATVVNAHVVLGTITLTLNPEYLVGYSNIPKRVLGYAAAPVRTTPTKLS